MDFAEMIAWEVYCHFLMFYCLFSHRRYDVGLHQPTFHRLLKSSEKSFPSFRVIDHHPLYARDRDGIFLPERNMSFLLLRDQRNGQAPSLRKNPRRQKHASHAALRRAALTTRLFLHLFLWNSPRVPRLCFPFSVLVWLSAAFPRQSMHKPTAMSLIRLDRSGEPDPWPLSADRLEKEHKPQMVLDSIPGKSHPGTEEERRRLHLVTMRAGNTPVA